MSQLSKPFMAKAGLALAGLTLAACGGGSSGSDTDGKASVSKDLDDASIAVGLKYTAGKAGKADASLDPVKIGFVNQQGGTPAFPEYEGAADAAVKFINEYLGGIDGHPIELVKCVIQSEEDGQKCAAEFLADPKIHAASLGVAVVGNATFYKTVDGKFPVLVAASGGVADGTTPHVYELDGGGSTVLAAFAKAAQDNGDTKIAVISTGNPGGKFAAGQVLAPSLKKAGIESTVAYVSDTATTPEYTSAVQASGAKDADATMLIASGADQCISVYKALEQLGVKKNVITAYGCYGDPVPEATGGGPKNWTFFGNSDNQRAETNDEAATFRNVMKAGGAEKFTNVGSTPKTFTDIFALSKIGNEAGFENLSGKAFEDGINALRAPVFMVPGGIKCGHQPDKMYVGICGDSASSSSYTDGKWVLGDPVKTIEFTP